MNTCSGSAAPDVWRELYGEQSIIAQGENASGDYRIKRHCAFRERTIREQLSLVFGASPLDVLIDIGCSQGLFAEHLGLFAAHTIGVDYAQEALQYCRNHNRYSMQLFADGVRLPLPEKSVDACVLLDSLTSCDMPDILITEACRVLKPGGKIFIETLCYRGVALETLRFLRATFRDLLRRSKTASVVEIVQRSFRRSFRPAILDLPLIRPSKNDLLSALDNLGIKHISVHQTRAFKLFPRERIIVYGAKIS